MNQIQSLALLVSLYKDLNKLHPAINARALKCNRMWNTTLTRLIHLPNKKSNGLKEGISVKNIHTEIF